MANLWKYDFSQNRIELICHSAETFAGDESPAGFKTHVTFSVREGNRRGKCEENGSLEESGGFVPLGWERVTAEEWVFICVFLQKWWSGGLTAPTWWLGGRVMQSSMWVWVGENAESSSNGSVLTVLAKFQSETQCTGQFPMIVNGTETKDHMSMCPAVRELLLRFN